MQVSTAGTSLSIVVPVYNSHESLPVLVQRIADVLFPLKMQFELILVDDNSRDNSWDVVCQLQARCSWIQGLRLARNFGQQAATLCGIRAAQYETIITLDDDLQNPPEEIPRLLAALTPFVDVVYGVAKAGGHGFLRNLATRSTKKAMSLIMGMPMMTDLSAFRAFRRSICHSFESFSSPKVSIDVLLSWGTHRFQSIHVRQDERTHGVSNYTLNKLVAHVINLIVGFSTVPLRIATFMGLAMTALGFLLLVYVTINFAINGSRVPGFTFLASMIAIFSGTQLSLMGIVGEYVGRIYQRSIGLPPYVVAETRRQDALALLPKIAR